MDCAARFEADLFGIELEVKSLQEPIFVGLHFKPGRGRLHGAEQVQIQHGEIAQRVTFGFGRNGLRGIADLLAAVKNPPPLFDIFGDFLRGAQRDERCGRAEMVFDKPNIHHAPEEHDGDADGSMKQHVVERTC